MFFKKGAMELSMSFMVVILISLVVFAFGVRFIYSLASEANKMKDNTFDDLDKKIGNILCQGSERVCIAGDTKTIKRGNFDVFGIKILNIDDNLFFDISVQQSKIIDKNKNEIAGPLLLVKYRPTIKIEQNAEGNLAVGIEVPTNAVSGMYIFNVDVKHRGAAPNDLYVPTQKVYVEVP